MLFGDLKSWLPELLAGLWKNRLNDRSFSPAQGPFPTATQRRLGLEAMKMLGFDFNGGRLDVSAHPFCGGVREDVRITTRYDEDELLSALFGVIHETGRTLPSKPSASVGPASPLRWRALTAIHESQSLFFKCSWAAATLSEASASGGSCPFRQPGGIQRREFYCVEPAREAGYIRVDADEVDIRHVVLRYEIERALM